MENEKVTEEFDVVEIHPKMNCKMCQERGWFNYWEPGKAGVSRAYTKNGHTKTNDYDPVKRPCGCLNEQYIKLDPGVSPKFEEKDQRVFIKLQIPKQKAD